MRERETLCFEVVGGSVSLAARHTRVVSRDTAEESVERLEVRVVGAVAQRFQRSELVVQVFVPGTVDHPSGSGRGRKRESCERECLSLYLPVGADVLIETTTTNASLATVRCTQPRELFVFACDMAAHARVPLDGSQSMSTQRSILSSPCGRHDRLRTASQARETNRLWFFWLFVVASASISANSFSMLSRLWLWLPPTSWSSSSVAGSLD